MNSTKTDAIPFQIWMSHDLHAALKASAALERVTMHQFVTRILEERTKGIRELIGTNKGKGESMVPAN